MSELLSSSDVVVLKQKNIQKRMKKIVHTINCLIGATRMPAKLITIAPTARNFGN